MGTIGTNGTELLGRRRPFLRLSEVAAILGIGRSTVYRWAEEGRIPVVELGGERGRFVPTAALVELIDAGTELALENLVAQRPADENEPPAISHAD